MLAEAGAGTCGLFIGCLPFHFRRSLGFIINTGCIPLHSSQAALDAREAQNLGDAVAKLGVSLEEIFGGALLDLTWDWPHVLGHVLDHALAHLLAHDVAEEVAGLLEVAVGVVGSVPAH